MRRVAVRHEVLPLKTAFSISRGTRTEISVVVVEIVDGAHTGRGECFPHSRYGESVASVEAQIAGATGPVAAGLTREQLLTTLPNGAARNAIDCALWDLETKIARDEDPAIRAWQLAGLADFKPVQSVMTISLDDPQAMAAAAATAVGDGYGKLKVKLGSDDGRDDQRIAAVRSVAGDASLVVDANEGWRAPDLARYLAAMADAGVDMVEQPLPTGDDAALLNHGFDVPVGADESFHTRADLEGLRDKYDVVNIKLDKTGGLTEACLAAQAARQMGFEVMVGCMLGTSLAMAPATIVAQHAAYVDLDGPLWLGEDRAHGIAFERGRIDGFAPELWG